MGGRPWFQSTARKKSDRDCSPRSCAIAISAEMSCAIFSDLSLKLDREKRRWFFEKEIG